MRLAGLLGFTFFFLTLGAAVADTKDRDGDRAPPVLNFTMKDIDGKEVKLSQFKGKVVVLVNVASECGLTPQYEGLEALYRKYKDKGLVVVGVPANEFGAQEPGTDAEIKKFCTDNYKVTFPMMSKVVVDGEGITPLYRFLTSKETNPDFAGPIKWNFTKFLVGREGKVVARFGPEVEPEAMVKKIEQELEKK
jgi:glutathione peroxidase